MAAQNRHRRVRPALAIAAMLAIAGCQQPLVIPGSPGGSPSPGTGSEAARMPQLIHAAFDPPHVPEGASSRLSWSTRYTDRVRITDLGTRPPNGSVVITPRPGLIYEITLINAYGSSTHRIAGGSVGYAPSIIGPDSDGEGPSGPNPVGPPIIGPMPDGPGGTVGPNPVGPPIRPPVERDIYRLEAPSQQPSVTVPASRPQLQQQQLERLQRMQEMQPLQPMRP
jgi:hypothetical protein